MSLVVASTTEKSNARDADTSQGEERCLSPVTGGQHDKSVDRFVSGRFDASFTNVPPETLAGWHRPFARY
jgi:hypothetical protein